jgi:hypothetical protein
MHSDEESEEFKDLATKIMNISGVFNIGDYVPFLKPFDLQAIRLECIQINLRVDRFFHKIIQDHLKEKKKANESKDFLDVMLSDPGVDGVSDRLDEITIKGVAIVSCSIFLELIYRFPKLLVLNLVNGCVQ